MVAADVLFMRRIEHIDHTKTRNRFDKKCQALRRHYHANCLFNRFPSPVPGLAFAFDDAGILRGEFACTGYQQGYDGMVHGGVIAAIIDASMAQCLMGHGVVGLTTHLSIKYRKPVTIREKAIVETTIREVHAGCLYSLECTIVQQKCRAVQATGKFYRQEGYAGNRARNI